MRPFWKHFWRESVWLLLSFRNRVANLVSISNLVINCIELSFERYIFKWSQLSFLLSFSIGNSKFNLKGDIILFVVSGDIQVQNPNLAKGCNSKAIPLCCSPMFIMTSGQLYFRSWILYVAKSYDFKGDAIVSSCFISRLCLCNPIFLITKSKYVWFSDYSFCCWNVRRNIQVQEKLFKILMCQSHNSKS